MTPRSPTRALYAQFADGRFVLRFSDRPQTWEGAAGEKLDTLAERAMEERARAGLPDLRAQRLPFVVDASLAAAPRARMAG